MDKIRFIIRLIIVILAIWLFSKLVGIKFTYIAAYTLTLIIMVPIIYALFLIENSERYNNFLDTVRKELNIEIEIIKRRKNGHN